nr:ASCH domain-containing protein [Vagococcus allomyrinae]
MANDLANLVMTGEKTATSSLVPFNDYRNRKVSEVGDCYLLMGGNKECLAFLQITKTETCSFASITPQFAKEEGDGTFERWLEIHQAYYGHQMTLLGESLQPETKLHCEWFNVIHDLRN